MAIFRILTKMGNAGGGTATLSYGTGYHAATLAPRPNTLSRLADANAAAVATCRQVVRWPRR